ncbi:Holliday junction branch migration protein RuvA [Microbacterium sp. SORGH_AS_0862]|uniref:Holliday junction branch migration protein RuvA n=1 Tax=Microbacterium sp. SORGH_AS_0862 TaxID=3041789 RepID=UPI00278D9F26|nr:Holliday junction branch migration protein RuvA [Microbacterium sp. SORGH_AS_0862]MDQ1207010.1 Holliday junction DNA helicase RuvA [Microbacterium sp. SORGH_AS_0862]
MIASLRGSVVHASSDGLVLEVAGVGYSVAVTPDVSRTVRLGDEILLHTHMIVREDALSLVGFRTREELAVFAALIAVSGVGPKSALGVLAELSIDQIAQAVADEADGPFRKVSGIGPKTAKLIVVQLAGKLAPPTASATGSSAASTDLVDQLAQALVGLGWSERVAAETAAVVVADAPEERTVAALLRRALAALGPARGEAVRG